MTAGPDLAAGERAQDRPPAGQPVGTVVGALRNQGRSGHITTTHRPGCAFARTPPGNAALWPRPERDLMTGPDRTGPGRPAGTARLTARRPPPHMDADAARPPARAGGTRASQPGRDDDTRPGTDSAARRAGRLRPSRGWHDHHPPAGHPHAARRTGRAVLLRLARMASRPTRPPGPPAPHPPQRA